MESIEKLGGIGYMGCMVRFGSLGSADRVECLDSLVRVDRFGRLERLGR